MDKFDYNNQDIDTWILNTPRVFAKLQQDLRGGKAVTNLLAREKLHVFLANTKDKLGGKQ